MQMSISVLLPEPSLLMGGTSMDLLTAVLILNSILSHFMICRYLNLFSNVGGI